MSASQHLSTNIIIFKPLFNIPAFLPTSGELTKHFTATSILTFTIQIIYIDIHNTKQWLSTLTGYTGKISTRWLQTKKIPKLLWRRKCWLPSLSNNNTNDIPLSKSSFLSNLFSLILLYHVDFDEIPNWHNHTAENGINNNIKSYLQKLPHSYAQLQENMTKANTPISCCHGGNDDSALAWTTTEIQRSCNYKEKSNLNNLWFYKQKLTQHGQKRIMLGARLLSKSCSVMCCSYGQCNFQQASHQSHASHWKQLTVSMPNSKPTIFLMGKELFMWTRC